MTRKHVLMGSAWILAGAIALMGCSRQVTMEGEVVAKDSIGGTAGKIHINDGGKGGVPVVFVHSFAGSTKHWEAQLAHLRPTRRAIAIDLRGHGESEPPADGNYAVTALADDIDEVADELHLDRFVLVGHSMGGAASLAYAGEHADEVAGLVLVGAPGKSPPEMKAQIMSALETDYDQTMERFWNDLLAKARPEVAARIREERMAVQRDASLKMIRAIFDYDPTPALAAYRGPTLIIDAEGEDAPGGLHDLSPGIPHKVIMGTSHWVQLDEPEQFNRILDEFLATVK